MASMHVHRKLIIRLLLAWILLSVLSGAIFFLSDENTKDR